MTLTNNASDTALTCAFNVPARKTSRNTTSLTTLRPEPRSTAPPASLCSTACGPPGYLWPSVSVLAVRSPWLPNCVVILIAYARHVRTSDRWHTRLVQLVPACVRSRTQTASEQRPSNAQQARHRATPERRPRGTRAENMHVFGGEDCRTPIRFGRASSRLVDNGTSGISDQSRSTIAETTPSLAHVARNRPRSPMRAKSLENPRTRASIDRPRPDLVKLARNCTTRPCNFHQSDFDLPGHAYYRARRSASAAHQRKHAQPPPSCTSATSALSVLRKRSTARCADERPPCA